MTIENLRSGLNLHEGVRDDPSYNKLEIGDFFSPNTPAGSATRNSSIQSAVRVENAVGLSGFFQCMSTSKLNVTGIGFESSFEDVSHFSRVFKERFDTPPMTCRQGAA